MSNTLDFGDGKMQPYDQTKPSTLSEGYFDENGKLKPYSERYRERRNAEQKVEAIRRQVAERLEKTETTDEKVMRYSEQRIAELKDRLRGHLTPDERSLARRQLHVLEVGAKEAEGRIAEQSRIDKLSKDRRVQLARESADAMERSWRAIYGEGAKEEDVMLAIEIARSNEFDSPDSLYSAFKEIETKIAEDSAEFERKKASDLEHAALKSAADAAKAQLSAGQAQIRLEKVKDTNE